MEIDALKIKQVLNNLITNAFKFSHSQSRVEVHVTQQDTLAVIAVKDRGLGIPAAQLDQLFQPFHNLQRWGTAGEKSIGLGLTICRKIVEGHKGKFWAESEQGQGAVFYFSLPLE